MHGCSLVTIDLQCQDRAHRVFDDQAGFACTKRGRFAAKCSPSRTKGELHPCIAPSLLQRTARSLLTELAVAAFVKSWVFADSYTTKKIALESPT